MTQIERLKLRLNITDNSEDLLLEDILLTAQSAVLTRRYPFGTELTAVPAMYLDLQIRIAIDLYNKQGAEGQKSHSENGISRGYQNSWISEDLLSEITPMSGVVT